MRKHRFPLGIFTGLVIIWSAIMLSELVFQWASWHALDRESAYLVVASLSRSHNQLLSVVLLSVAVAIPLTAANYTPKLLRMFLTDPLHVGVLATYALATVHANWVMFVSRGDMVPEGLSLAVMITSGLGFAGVVPYFFYVIRFVEPTTLVKSIRAQGVRATGHAVRSKRGRPQSKLLLAHAIHNLGSLVLKSVDGMGRQAAGQGILAIREVLADYGRQKAHLDPSWFEATKSEFRGLSREALDFTTADRCWVEVLALRDLHLSFEAALDRMPDVVISIADTVRGIGVDAEYRSDLAVVDNVIRAFNAMLRSAINQNRPHAVFDVLAQYRALTDECMTSRPEIGPEVIGYFQHYAVRARRRRMEFIPELFLYDAGALLRGAADENATNLEPLKDEFTKLLHTLSAEPSVPLACATLVTTGAMLPRLEDSEFEAWMQKVSVLPTSLMKDALRILDKTASPRYHELTSRQVDLNFMPPPELEALQERIRPWLDTPHAEPDTTQSA